MEAAARTTGSISIRAESIGQAMKSAVGCGAGGVVVVSGSVYLVGEARSLLFGGELGGVE